LVKEVAIHAHIKNWTNARTNKSMIERNCKETTFVKIPQQETANRIETTFVKIKKT
jgi:hypothetical protein